MEAVLTIEPRRALRPGRAAAQTRIVPVRLMSTVSAKATGSCSRPRRMTPAQLTTTSSSPRPSTSAAHRRAVAHVEAPHLDARCAAGRLDLGLGRAGGDDGVAGGARRPGRCRRRCRWWRR
jgi:hypothetical protein